MGPCSHSWREGEREINGKAGGEERLLEAVEVVEEGMVVIAR